LKGWTGGDQVPRITELANRVPTTGDVVRKLLRWLEESLELPVVFSALR
jgi:hypothetical protein